MNPNHDGKTGEFSSGSGGGARESHAHMDRLTNAAHSHLDNMDKNSLFVKSLGKFGGDPNSKMQNAPSEANDPVDKNSPFARSLASYKGVASVVTKDPMSTKQSRKYWGKQRDKQVRDFKKHMKRDN